MSEIEENYKLLLEASKRLIANADKETISDADVMKYFGITEKELEEVEELDIE